jgi:hypothetical protein
MHHAERGTDGVAVGALMRGDEKAAAFVEQRKQRGDGVLVRHVGNIRKNRR